MLYDKYQRTMGKILSVLKFIKRFRILILGIIALATAMTATGLSIKGLVYDKEECPISIAYGENFTYSAGALLNDVEYEFAEINSEDWTLTVPKTVGEYKVRAVSYRTGGRKNVGMVYPFTIKPKEVTVKAVDTVLGYGELPKVSGNLVAGDVAICQEVSYSNLQNKQEALITPVAESVKIISADGVDVTHNYAVSTEATKIDLTVRTLEVSIPSLEGVYDGTVYSSSEYQIDNGSLYGSDSLSFTFEQSLVDVGRVQNQANLKILTADGIDVTSYYYVVIKCGDIVVNKRPISIRTLGKTFIYDGSKKTFGFCIIEPEIFNNYGLVQGHYLSLRKQSIIGITNVGTVENTLVYDVLNEKGQIVTQNYEIDYTYGYISVEKREVEIHIKDAEFVYDGDDKFSTEYQFDVQSKENLNNGIVIGHQVSPLDQSKVEKFIDVGTYDNYHEIIIKANNVDVSGNYKITLSKGQLAIKHREVEVTTPSGEWIYDGKTHRAEYALEEQSEGLGGYFRYFAETDFKLVDGHYFKIEDFTEVNTVTRTTDGVTALSQSNVIELLVFNAKGEDVSKNYNVQNVSIGNLLVKPRVINIETIDLKREYNGRPLFSNQYKELPLDALAENQSITSFEGGVKLTYASVVEREDNPITSFAIKDASGTDVTSNYDATIIPGRLEVLKRGVKIITPNGEWTYDGNYHRGVLFGGYSEYFDYAEDTAFEIVVGENFVIDQFTEVAFVTRDLNGTPVKVKNSLKLKVEAPDPENQGGVIDVSSSYDLSYVYGDLLINPYTLAFVANSGQKIYDATPLEDSGYVTYDVLGDGRIEKPIVDGDVANVSVVGSITDVGSVVNSISVIDITRDGNSVKGSYDIETLNGTLTVTERKVYIRTPSGIWEYDGKDHVGVWDDINGKYSPYFDYYTVNGEAVHADNKVVDEQVLEFDLIKVVNVLRDTNDKNNILSVKNNPTVWTVKDRESGRDVSSNYLVTVVDTAVGTLTITPRDIIVTTVDVVEEYDGRYHYDYESTYADDLADGQEIQVETYEKLKYAGKIDNKQTVIVVKGTEDVTNNYDVTYAYGEIEVTRKPITITVGDMEKVYDGTNNIPKEIYDYEISPELVAGDRESVELYCAEKKVGVHDCVVKSVVISNDERADVDSYEITLAKGSFNITKKPITITTGEGNKVYDGIELRSSEYQITAGGLVSGHYVAELTTNGSITNIGSVENGIETLVIKDEAGEDVTENYEVTVVKGILTITKRPIKLTPKAYKEVYDGTEQKLGDEGYIISGGSLAPNERIVKFTTSAVSTNVIDTENRIVEVVIKNALDEEVTSNYEIDASDTARFEIYKRKVSLVTPNGEWTYDGKWHVATFTNEGRYSDYFDYASDTEYKVANGQVFDIVKKTQVRYVIRISENEWLSTANEIVIDVLDGNESVLSNYEIEIEYGSLRINPYEITFTADSHTKVYDDEELTNEGYTTNVPMIQGDEEEVWFDGGITDVGSVASVMGVDKITDVEGIDVTGCYKITIVNGTLTVTKRVIHVNTPSGVWEYDGEEHVATFTNEGRYSDYFDYASDTEYKVVNGHVMTYVELIKVTDVMRDPSNREIIISKDNVLEFRVKKGEVDKTRNYDIIIEDCGKLTITPRDIVVTTGNYSGVYDGLTHSNCQDTVANNLVNGQKIKITTYASIKDKGVIDNEQTVIVVKEDNENIEYTNNYDISYVYGKLEVLERRVMLKTPSGEWEYDGEEHRAIYVNDGRYSDYFDYKEGTPYGFVNFHTVKIISYTYMKYVKTEGEPTIENKIEVEIYDENGLLVKDGNYNVSYEFGTLEITKKAITITAGDMEKYYDGTSIVPIPHDYTITPELARGDVCSLSLACDGKNVGIYELKIIGLSIIDEDDVDVVGCYNITTQPGTLTIKKRPITVSIGNQEKIYDGTPFVPTYTITGMGLANNQVVSKFTTTETITDVGEVDCFIDEIIITDSDGIDVTNNYEITKEDGKLKITPRNVTIKPRDEVKVYDGTPLVATSWEIVPGSLAIAPNQDVSEITYSGSQIVVGVSDSNITSLVIVDKNGRDVSFNYVFTLNKGELKVLPRPILITTGSASKVYDGTPLVCGDKTVDGLLDSDLVVLNINGSQTKVGTSDNTVENGVEGIKILKGEEDVTSCYEITLELGELKVLPRPILITTGSASKVYDGTPLVCGDKTVDGLLDGDLVVLNINGSQTKVGTSDNTVENGVDGIKILKGEEDVTSCYEITLELGELTVEKPQGGGSGGDSGEGGEGGGSGGGDDEGGEGGSGGGGINIPTDGDLSGGGGSPGSSGEIKLLYEITSDADGRVYLRLKSFGDFAYVKWLDAPVYDGEINPLELVSIALKKGGFTKSTITVKKLVDNMPWLLPYFADFTDIDSLDDTYITVNDWTEYTLCLYLYEYGIYDGYTLIGTEYEAFEAEYREFVYDNYLSLPEDDETLETLDDVISKLDVNSETLIYDVATYISTYLPYDLETPDYEGNYVTYFFKHAKSAVCRHYATAATALYRRLGIPARYTTGFVGEVSSQDKTFINTMNAHAWVEVYVDGLGWVVIEVTGSGNGGGGPSIDNKIKVKPKDVNVIFDPENPVVKAENEIDDFYVADLIEKGYAFFVEVEGEQNGVGSSKSRITKLVIFDRDGNDVTSEFEVEYLEGNITVCGEFYVEVYEVNFVYDGEVHYYNNDWDFEIVCPDGYEIIFDASGIGLKDVGKLDMSVFDDLVVTVLFNGEDVTQENKVLFIGEPMTITARGIEVTTGSTTKPYDGSPLSNSEYRLSKGSLIEDHVLTCVLEASITEVGNIENVVKSYAITDVNGNDVTKNYELSFVFGDLIITE